MNFPSFWKSAAAGLILLAPLAAPAQQHFNGAKAYEYARQFAAIGPRWPTGPGHAKAEQFLREKFPKWRVEYSLDRYVKRGYLEQDERTMLHIGWRTRAEVDEKTLMTMLLSRGTREVTPP